MRDPDFGDLDHTCTALVGRVGEHGLGTCRGIEDQLSVELVAGERDSGRWPLADKRTRPTGRQRPHPLRLMPVTIAASATATVHDGTLWRDLEIRWPLRKAAGVRRPCAHRRTARRPAADRRASAHRPGAGDDDAGRTASDRARSLRHRPGRPAQPNRTRIPRVAGEVGNEHGDPIGPCERELKRHNPRDRPQGRLDPWRHASFTRLRLGWRRWRLEELAQRGRDSNSPPGAGPYGLWAIPRIR